VYSLTNYNKQPVDSDNTHWIKLWKTPSNQRLKSYKILINGVEVIKTKIPVVHTLMRCINKG